MTIQPIELAPVLRAVLWPSIVALALVIFRRQLPDLLRILSQRIDKLSVAGVSLVLAELPEMRSAAIEIEVRQLNAAPHIQSGVSNISGVFDEVQRGAGPIYILVDLGSEANPGWLTSRLYLLAFLITLLDRPIYLVFLETVGQLRKQFVGTANNVRWALARRYGWFESAMAAAFAICGGIYCGPNAALMLNPVSSFQFDSATGRLASWQVTQLMQKFLELIRMQQSASPPTDAAEWTTLSNGQLEHARWLDGARIERLVARDLSTSSVVLTPKQTVDSIGEIVLAQRDHLVAVLEMDRTFRSLVDRSATLESLGSAFLKQRRSENQTPPVGDPSGW
jgi:hypothetical protein